MRVRWKRPRPVGVEVLADYSLPQVFCPHCGETWGDGMVYFPLLNPPFLNKEEFNYDRVVSLEEFEQVVKRFEREAGRRLQLVPGATIGNKGISVPTSRLQDFIWGAITLPQISKRASQLLTDEGIKLFTGECSTLLKGRNIGTHKVLQVELAQLLTEKSVEQLRLIHCADCGDYRAKPAVPICKPWKLGEYEPEDLSFVKSKWPAGESLVMCIETSGLIARPEFVQAVEKHKLTGIQFIPCGKFV